MLKISLFLKKISLNKILLIMIPFEVIISLIFFFILKINFKYTSLIISFLIGYSFILTNLIIVLLYKFFLLLKEKELEIIKKNSVINLLGFISHEIRNLLNIINGLIGSSLENMKDLNNNNKEDIINIERESYDIIISDLNNVIESSKMLEFTVTNILNIKKIEANKLDLYNKIINLDELIKEIVNIISKKIIEKKIIFITNYDNNLKLYLDPFRTKQILLNFLINAIKYTDKGLVSLQIQEINNMIRFSVLDTGKGIKEDIQHKIFEPYCHDNSNNFSNQESIGLGLYLCKLLVKQMGGNIGFQSKYNVGSIFWIEFPLKIIKLENI